jgi:NAD(P)H-dependent flavin oxidoreductase YrpB (nitropropane dioxygenase family)
MSVQTSITKQLGIRHPILLAGMGQTSGAALAAAVSNAGGLGVIGGVGYTPSMLREIIAELKSLLRDASLPFGIDILLPQVGGSARKTNYDYTKGKLSDIVDVVIESGARVFVSAVGVPPRWVVDKLHAHGILYMNMIGHPKHVHKACDVGADLICAQGGEAGGHTGEIPTSVLIPACADICKQYKSPLTGESVGLVAAGGVADGRGVAAMLMLGAGAAWIGTRFVVAVESGASEAAKRNIVEAGFDSTIKSTIWTGRPLRSLKTEYVRQWEEDRLEEQKKLLGQGRLPFDVDQEKLMAENKWTDEIEDQSTVRPMGMVSALVSKGGQKGGEIVEEIARETYEVLSRVGALVQGPKQKL